MKKFVIALAALIAAAGVPAAEATLNLYRIEGYVRDNLGRPLGGATVSDEAGRSATAGDDGFYSLAVPEARAYDLSAVRSNTDKRTQRVVVGTTDLVKPLDFTLWYLLTSSVSKTAVSTAKGAFTLQLTAVSSAPSPGTPGQAGSSCVKVLDSRTATTHDAWSQANWTDPWQWNKSIELAQGTGEGNYTLTPRAVDCATGTTLSKPTAYAVPYTVDNTPPSIPRDSLVPADGTNTAHGASQRLLATVKDSLSGVLSSSIAFHLHDAQGNEVFKSGSTPSTRVTFSSSTGQAATPPVPVLQEGKLYFTTVVATDAAGNETITRHSDGIYGGGFMPTHTEATPTTASIPSTPCTVSPSVLMAGPHIGMKPVFCENVKVQLDAVSVALGGLRHIDSGYLGQTFALNGAVLKGTVAEGAEISYPAHQGDDPNWGPKTRSMLFTLDYSLSQRINVQVLGQQVGIGTLATYVPGTWQGGASLEMPTTTTTPSFSTCADPSTSTASVRCSPDPLDARFVVVLEPTANQAGAAARHTSALGVQVRGWDGPAYSAFVPPESLAALAADPDVAKVRRETSGSELFPDDWEDYYYDTDEQALTPQIRALFGDRFGGDWIDRSVVPAEWRIGVKNATPADQAALDGLTWWDSRVKVRSVAHSAADFRTYMETATGVLQAEGVHVMGMSPFHPAQRLVIEVTSFTAETEAALLAALPSGVPEIRAVSVDINRPDHSNQVEGLPVEGGQLTMTPTEVGQGNCTVSFAAKKSAGGGGILYGGVTAGHCARSGDTAYFNNNHVYNKNPTFLYSSWFAQTENYGKIASDSAVFGGLDEATVSNQVFVGHGGVHREITGKFGNDDIKIAQHTCFQGSTSAQPTEANGYTGTFDNCGIIKKEWANQEIGKKVTNLRVVIRSWCFGIVTAQPGDSGGPTYYADNPTVKIKGIHSYSRTPEEQLTQLVRAPLNSGYAQQTTPAQDAQEREACFTSVSDFETAAGWLLHY